MKENKSKLKVSILSLSLLTVMAGAAIAPALNTIMAYFSDTNKALVQMIISIPALFIALTNLIFPKLTKILKSKDLTIIGLILYILGGVVAGCFNNIYVILIFRALVGIGVGIIMPMSTGLLSYYFDRNEQGKLMGYSSAMNQMGGVLATLISGFLAKISWRASFLVYLMGLFSIILVILFLPNDKISKEETKNEDVKENTFKNYFFYLLSMFLLMFTFFIYPSTFAIEEGKVGLSQSLISIIMAGADFIAFFGGLAFIHIKKGFGKYTKIVSPILFTLGYVFLFLIKGIYGAILGSIFIGFANGEGIPYIMSEASIKAGKNAVSTVLPLISFSLYISQFLTPIILSITENLLGNINHASFLVAIISGILFLISSLKIKSDN